MTEEIKKKRGRPPSQNPSNVVLNFRLTKNQNEIFKSMGGVAFIKKMINEKSL